MSNKKNAKRDAIIKRKAVFITLLLYLGVIGAFTFFPYSTSFFEGENASSEVKTEKKRKNISPKKSRKISSKYQKAKASLKK